MKPFFLGRRWINNQRKSHSVWYNTPHWKIIALICYAWRSPKVTLITAFVSIVEWKQARWPPLFVTFLISPCLVTATYQVSWEIYGGIFCQGITLRIVLINWLAFICWLGRIYLQYLRKVCFIIKFCGNSADSNGSGMSTSEFKAFRHVLMRLLHLLVPPILVPRGRVPFGQKERGLWGRECSLQCTNSTGTTQHFSANDKTNHARWEQKNQSSFILGSITKLSSWFVGKERDLQRGRSRCFLRRRRHPPRGSEACSPRKFWKIAGFHTVKLWD